MGAVAESTFERQAELLETIHRCARELRDLVGDTLEITIAPANRRDTRAAGRTRAAVLAVFEARPGEWVAARDVSPQVEGSSYGAIREMLRTLRAEGVLEHNGERTTRARYRLKPDQRPGGASQNGHRPDPAADRAPVLDRLVAALRDEAGTVTELAMRLDIPRREVLSAIEHLTDQGAVVKCGTRFPQRHDVYGAADE